ncbi:MAG: ABC transporter permease subunit, partial [Kiloniellales bacterium]
LGRGWLAGGARGGGGQAPRIAAEGGLALLLVFSGAGLAAMVFWSLAWRWPYPATLPSSWTLATWSQQAGSLSRTGATTLALGLLAAMVALLLTLGCLENETRRQMTMSRRALFLLYLPLLVPQIAFLFGAQVLAIELGFDGSWLALVWGHLLFVLPYVFLALGEPYRALDRRYIEIAHCLGAGPARVFWHIKLPLLLRPILAALAIGFAVSVAQYLPTIFLGAGRYATLTTEAVTLAGGGDRRVLAATALVQALLPTLAFLAALAVPQRPGLFASRPETAA